MTLPGRRRLLAALIALVAALAIAAGLGVRREPPATMGAPAPKPPALPSQPAASSSAAPPPPAGPAELAVVAPLVPGGDLAGFRVQAIHGVERGQMVVSCVRGKAVVRLHIALAGADPAALPPATAGSYAIYYSLRGGASPDDGDRLATGLGRVIEAHGPVPPPPGMTTFTPEPKPAMTL